MTLILFGLVILSVVFLARSYVNKYSVLFTMMLWSLVVTIYLILMYTVKASIYSESGTFFVNVDNIIYSFSRKSVLREDIIIRIFNCCSVIYLVSQPLFVNAYVSRTKKRAAIKLLSVITTVIIPLYLLYFYDPHTSYNLYISVVEGKISFTFIAIADLFNYLVMFFYLIYPVGGFVISNSKIKSPLRKKQFLGVTICVMLLNVVFSIIYTLGVIRRIYIFNDIASILPSASSYHVNSKIYIYAMFFMIIVTIVEFVVIQKYELTKNLGKMNKYILKKNMSSINVNLINVFHTFKNVVFTYQILIRKARSEKGEAKDKTLEELDFQVSEYINKLSKMLDINNEIDVNTDFVSVNSVIDEALESVNLPENIEIVKKYSGDDIKMIADSFYMVEAFSNIIKNAVEAIQKKNKKGIIVIKTDTDAEWVIVEIDDNGIGIDKKNIGKIFKPFYTTKSRISNWGIGLSYTSKIIKQHKGYIYIESNENVGTSFYVHLPKG